MNNKIDELWISSNEKMPEQNEYVIATILCHLDAEDGYEEEDNIYVGIGSIKDGFNLGGDGTAWVDDEYIRILAWMPSPKPYGKLNEVEE